MTKAWREVTVGRSSEETPRGKHDGEAPTFPLKAAQLRAHLKCLYTKTCSTGNMQEELEVHAQSQKPMTLWWLQRCGTWDSTWWHAVMDSYRIFRKTRPRMQGKTRVDKVLSNSEAGCNFKDSPPWSQELDQATFWGPFHPKSFYDATIICLEIILDVERTQTMNFWYKLS